MSSPGSVNAGRESAQLPPSPPSSHGFQHAAWPSNGQGELAIGGFPDVPLDPMHLAPRQQMDSHPAASNLAAQSPAELVDPLISRHTTQLNAPLAQNTQDPASIGVDFDWAYPRLPTDLHDMLSGLFTA